MNFPRVQMSSRLIPFAAFVAFQLLLGTLAGAQPAGAEAPPEVSTVEQLLESVESLRSEYHRLQEMEAKGEEQTLIVLKMRKKLFEFMRAVDDLVTHVVRQKQEGVKRPPGLRRSRKLLLEMDRTIPMYIDMLEADAAEIRAALSEEPAKSHSDLLIGIREIDEILDDAYPFFLGHLERRENLGLNAGNGRKQLKRRASARASMLGVRVELLRARRREAERAAARSADDAAFQILVNAADEELDDAATNLWAICDVMDELGLETAEHREVLIRATGDITSDVFDVDVLIGLYDEAVDAARDWLDRRGPPLFARAGLFATILALFWMLSGVVRRIASRLTEQAEHVSELSRNILVGVASRMVIALGFFVALSQVGVNVTALLTGLGIVGFIVGFALQDTLSNFASGTMILLYRPFDVGDVIEAGGVFGNVDGMSLVSTTILTFDNQTLIIPNSKIWGDVIRNVTTQDTRRVDLEFGFSHALDIVRAEEILASILSEHSKVLEDPEPLIKVHKLTDLTTRIVVRPWVKREDYWEVYWDVTREVKLRLDREGVPVGVQQLAVQSLVESPD